MLPSSSTNANPAMLTASHAMLTRSGGPRSTLPKGTFLGVWVPKVKETQVKGQVYGPYRKQTPRMTAATTPPAAVLFPPRFVLQTDEDTDSDEDMAELLAEVKEEIEVKVEDVPIMPLNRITRFQMISEEQHRAAAFCADLQRSFMYLDWKTPIISKQEFHHGVGQGYVYLVEMTLKDIHRSQWRQVWNYLQALGYRGDLEDTYVQFEEDNNDAIYQESGFNNVFFGNSMYFE